MTPERIPELVQALRTEAALVAAHLRHPRVAAA
jgi:hypothetical protein